MYSYSEQSTVSGKQCCQLCLEFSARISLFNSPKDAHFTSSWLLGTTNVELNSGIFNEATCRSAGFSCLAFYLGQKYALYLFLVERTHICNGISRPRMQDPTYLAGLSFILVGFTAIGIACFVYLIDDYDRVCHIGIHKAALTAILSWDVFVNLFLTFVFLHHIREFLLEPVIKTLCPCLRRYKPSGDLPSSPRLALMPQQRLIYVIRKTFWASLAILLSTVTNFSILLVFAGHEDIWICLFSCTLDSKCLLHYELS